MKQVILFSVLFYFQSATSQISLTRIQSLPQHLYESSGLILYQDTLLITHNDGGNPSELYALNLKGELVQTIRLSTIKNKDWEDLAQDNSGTIYIGDFGNNSNSRKSCQIYIVPPDLIHQKDITPQKISFTYEDQSQYPPDKAALNFDCEAFFWKDDSLYLFTKCRTSPFTGVSNIYVIPDKPGTYVAKKIASISLCSSDWRFCSVTAADYSEELNMVVLLTYSRIYLLTDFTGNHFHEAKIKSYQLSFIRQREGICFNGNSGWYMTDEYRAGLGGGNLYQLKIK